MNFSVRAKIILITVAILFFAVAANTLVSSRFFMAEYSSALQAETLVIGQTLQLQLDKLLKLGIPIEDLIGFEKQCQEAVSDHEEISYAMVVDTDGKILFHNAPSQLGQTLTAPELLEAVGKVERSTYVYSKQGEKYYDTIIPVLDTHGEHVAAVRVGFPAQSVTQKTNRLFIYSVGIAFASLGLATILLVSALSIWVTKPLQKLVHVIREIRHTGTADLSKRVEVSSNDEIGQLSTAFNQLISDLEESHDRIRLYTQELESRVEERTAALKLLNEQLQRDVTRRKQAEEQLQRYAAELEQSNEEIKQFAYIVSHDLRAPLVNLKGFAAELRAALAVVGSSLIETLPHLDEKQQRSVTLALQEDVPEALEFIDAAVSHMDAFINAVLKLSRLGHRELKLEPLHTEALVQASLQTLAHQLKGCQVTVGALPDVIVDRTSMEQIWGNLLGNAVKYLDPNRPGVIEITAQRADVASGDDEVTFHVRDNGRGIAPEDMAKVFAPFRRAGTQDVPGEGMGLAYVQTLLRRHGGRIWCESEPGVGTTFSFTIPNQPTKGMNDV